MSQSFYQLLIIRTHGLKAFIIFLTYFCLVLRAWGLNEARLLNQSKSGQTLLFNLGIHDGVQEGDYAVIAKEIRSMDLPDLRVVPVARARNIKINPDSSVWILFKVQEPELLVEGDKFLILSESTLLKGRRDPRLGRMVVVTKEGGASQEVLDALDDDEDRLSKKKKNYQEIAKAHGRELRMDQDVDLVDVEKWKSKGETKYRTALYKSPSAEEFRKEHRVSTFEKLVTAYLEKVNEPNFNYEAFYDQQMRDSSNYASKRSSFDTEYSRFMRDREEQSNSEAKLQRTILEKGDRWSEDFSDEELRGTLRAVSVLQEKDRRDFIIANPNRYNINLGYGMNLTDGQSKDDTSYRRSSQYSMDLNFEMIPFIKHQLLQKFTLGAGVRTNKSAFVSNGANMNLNETSLSVGANWYPIYAPYVISAPVFFLGTYFRTGYGNVQSPVASEKGNYTVNSFPGFIAGLRYNLKNNFGLRLAASFETLELSRYESNSLASTLPESKKLVEGKFSAGLGYSF